MAIKNKKCILFECENVEEMKTQCHRAPSPPSFHSIPPIKLRTANQALHRNRKREKAM